MNKSIKIFAVLISLTLVIGLLFAGIEFPNNNSTNGVVNNTTNVEKDNKDTVDTKEDVVYTIPEIEGDNPELPFDVEHKDVIESEDIKYSNETIMIKVSKPYNNKVEKNLKKQGVEKLEKMFELDNAIWYLGYLKEGQDRCPNGNHIDIVDGQAVVQ